MAEQELDKFENLPPSFQCSPKGEKHEEDSQTLEQSSESINESIAYMGEVFE